MAVEAPMVVAALTRAEEVPMEVTGEVPMGATGAEVSGLALAGDGAGDGADGAHGGVGVRLTTLTIRTIHIMLHPLQPSNNSLRCMLSLPLRKRSRVTGISAGTPRAIIPMCNNVQEAG